MFSKSAQSYPSKMSAKIWVLFAIVNVARSRDIIVGSNDFGHKIYDETKQAGPAIWRQTENVTITANDTEVISKIVIKDLRTEKDGDAKIVEGGEGQRNVTIELKSPTVLRGYEFHIEAFAVAEDQLKTMGQNSENTETNKHKEQSSSAVPNASVTSSVDLEKQLTTTASLPTNVASVNRRQNRDTENKDTSTQEVKNTTPLLADSASTTEISKVPLAHTPISITQKPDEKFPTVNREFQQGHNFGHPRVNIYEVNKTPESTVRSIPSANIQENIHTEGPPTITESNKNAETNLNTDKLYTHISYPQFGADSKQSSEQVVNTVLPVVEDKNKNVRHRRDVTKAMEEKSTQKPIETDNKATSETNPLNSQMQKHDEEHVLGGNGRSGIFVTSTSYSPSSLENQHDKDSRVKSQHANNEPLQHTAVRNRHFHKRFGNTAANDAASIPTSTENNKVSTPLPKISDSTQTGNKLIYSQASQLGKDQSSSTIPVVNEATTKSEINTEKLTNPTLKPEARDPDNQEPHDFNIRHTRDTTIVTSKNLSESLLPPVLRSSSTTLKPEIIPKNAQKTNVTSSDSQLINSESAQDKSSTGENLKSIAPDSMQTEEKDRNTRDTIDTNDNKDKLPSDNKDSLKSRTLKAVSVSSEHEPFGSLKKTQDSEKAPIEPESTNAENSPKAGNAEDKERQARDTGAVDESKEGKGESAEKTETTVAEMKPQEETKLNTEKNNLEKKSFKIDDKLAEHNDKAQKRVEIPVWNKEDQEEPSKNNNNVHDTDKDKQTPKTPREARETEEPKKSVNREHPRDISLATDLNIDSTEIPTSVKPKTIENQEKDLKNPNVEDTKKIKPTEKPE